jgi:hypothetical protein
MSFITHASGIDDVIADGANMQDIANKGLLDTGVSSQLSRRKRALVWYGSAIESQGKIKERLRQKLGKRKQLVCISMPLDVTVDNNVSMLSERE